MWKKAVIPRHSIDITLSLSKTHIPSSNIVGYAFDSIRQSKGPDGLRLSIVHSEPGKQKIKTRITFDPDDLNDPKLRGLFMSMSNFEDVPPSKLLDDADGDKYPMVEKIVSAALVPVTISILWLCLPVIQHALR
jgi:hypothetical protein